MSTIFPFFFCLITFSLFGDNAPPPALPAEAMQGYEGAFFKMFGTLIVLLIGIFGAVFALKRLSRGRLASSNAAHAIKILERRPLSPKTTLYLIEANGKRSVIAESQLEIKRLIDLGFFTETEAE